MEIQPLELSEAQKAYIEWVDYCQKQLLNGVGIPKHLIGVLDNDTIDPSFNTKWFAYIKKLMK